MAVNFDSDTISRQVAISAICSACGKIDCDKMDKCEKLQLPPANTSEIPNSSDTISRATAKEALMNAMNDVGVLDAEDINTVFQMLPPAQPEPSQVAKDIARILENGQDMRVIAQPERIKGRWISADTIFGGVPFYCSECGENTRDTVMGKPRWNFCPNCGAEMEVAT